MRALPEDFDTSALIGALADDWGFEVDSSEYAPVGGGSYHWVVSDREGTRAFVTVDDLDWKHWLGDTRESAFDGLRRAFDTAVALRDGGLEFVVAPIPTSGGETVRRIGPRHTIALFPFVDGEAGVFGRYEPRRARRRREDARRAPPSDACRCLGGKQVRPRSARSPAARSRTPER